MREIETEPVRRRADRDPEEIGKTFDRRRSWIPHESVSFRDIAREAEGDVRILGDALQPQRMRDEQGHHERAPRLHARGARAVRIAPA